MTETDDRLIIQSQLPWIVAVYLPRQKCYMVRGRFAQRNDATLYQRIVGDRVPSMRTLVYVFDAAHVVVEGEHLVPSVGAIAC
jgi:hypothetical protein